MVGGGRVLNLRNATLAAALALPFAAHGATAGDVQVAFELRELLDGRAARSQTSDRHLHRFYATRHGALAWWTGDDWSSAARGAVQQLARAEEHGLVPADYAASRLQSSVLRSGLREADPRSIAEAEILLTGAVLHYLDDLANGRIEDPREIGWEVNRTRRIDPPSALQRGLQSVDFASWMEGVAPSSKRYRDLRRAREAYAAAATEDWPFLPEGPLIEPGDRDPRVPAARRQLQMLEMLPSGGALSPTAARRSGNPSPGVTFVSYEAGSSGSSASSRSDARQSSQSHLYDSELEAAVRRFQERQGLLVDGRIGPETRAAMNISPRERLEEIDLNLERLRWITDNPGDRYVLVNIPSYELVAYADGAVAERMNVIVGQPDWKTPLFSDYIVNLKFAPDWTIPRNIVEEETLPRVRRDPGYLQRNNIGVYGRGGGRLNPASIDWYGVSSTSYVFRQEPGPGNALGLVRFSLTNSMGIYLHDTPNDALFGKSKRALSHGCVRVERPLDFAAYLLDYDPSWDRERIRAAMKSDDTNFHELDVSTPVHFIYLTAMVDESGTLQFRDDIYERNPVLRDALARAGRPNLS